MIVKDRFIRKEEFMRLLFTKIDGVDTYELSMWLKFQTDDEFVVVPREFVVLCISYFENMALKNAHKAPELVHETFMEFETIKKYM